MTRGSKTNRLEGSSSPISEVLSVKAESLKEDSKMNRFRVRYVDNNGKYRYSKPFTSCKVVSKGGVVGRDGEGKYCVETYIFTKGVKPQIQEEVCTDDFYGIFKWVNV